MSTIFTPTHSPDTDTGVGAGWSFKNDITVTGGSLGQVRVTFKGLPATGTWVVAHAGIGIITPGNAPKSGTVSELLFSGISGFTLAHDATITSDWLTFSFTGSDHLMVSMENTSGNASNSASNSNITAFFQNATGVWNDGTNAGFSSSTNTNYGINLIETQATPSTVGFRKTASSIGTRAGTRQLWKS
jgi:hypothetical protein